MSGIKSVQQKIDPDNLQNPFKQNIYHRSFCTHHITHPPTGSRACTHTQTRDASSRALYFLGRCSFCRLLTPLASFLRRLFIFASSKFSSGGAWDGLASRLANKLSPGSRRHQSMEIFDCQTSIKTSVLFTGLALSMQECK